MSSILDDYASIAEGLKRIKEEIDVPSDEKPPTEDPLKAMADHLQQLYGSGDFGGFFLQQ